MRYPLALAILTLASAAALGNEPSPEPPPDSQTPQQRVSVLFDAMRRGVYQETAFPDLGWEHIPALLERVGSQTRLSSFPGRAQVFT
jgi:hypothetical protein